MMTIDTILIDDEPKALAILKNKIERFCPNLDIIAETQSPEEAIVLIKEKKPQLIFLDISMPNLNGFDVLKTFKHPDFEIIFATAFDNYAIEAIKHCAIGYLEKPVDNKELIAAVNKATRSIEDKTALKKNQTLIENLGVQTLQNKKLVIPTTEGLEFVKIENIIHCEGVDGYTKIHFTEAKKPVLSSFSIGHFKQLLEQHQFYLIHKSHLINTQHISKYLNEGYAVMSNSQTLPVSRNRRPDFLKSFKQ